MRIVVDVEIAAPPAEVWSAIEDLSTHVAWMADAERITFRTERRRGLGTELDCRTRVGPLRTTDRLRVVEWEPPRSLGIVHRGAVTGSGRFALEPLDAGRTRFRWEETVGFPWFLLGSLGGALARPVLRRVWLGNLARLRERVEAGRAR